jgi:hypothetical protein
MHKSADGKQTSDTTAQLADICDARWMTFVQLTMAGSSYVQAFAVLNHDHISVSMHESSRFPLRSYGSTTAPALISMIRILVVLTFFFPISPVQASRLLHDFSSKFLF